MQARTHSTRSGESCISEHIIHRAEREGTRQTGTNHRVQAPVSPRTDRDCSKFKLVKVDFQVWLLDFYAALLPSHIHEVVVWSLLHLPTLALASVVGIHLTRAGA